VPEYLIETDLIVAYFNRADKLHKTSYRIFEECLQGTFKIGILQSALLEYELALKAMGVDESEIKDDLEDINLKIEESAGLIYLVPLTITQQIKAMELREKYNFSYFDSLHIAAAIIHNTPLITSDKEILTHKKTLPVIPPEKALKHKTHPK